jgi:hypothetical protein
MAELVESRPVLNPRLFSLWQAQYPEVDASSDSLLPVLRKIRQVFEDHFDRTWFSIVIDGLPIDFRTIRIIRGLVALESVHKGDEWFIYEAVLELERFVLLVRKYLLPVLKERLGVSRLVPHRLVRDETQYILRRLVVYTFPFNLQRLAELNQVLKRRLLEHYPSLGSA